MLGQQDPLFCYQGQGHVSPFQRTVQAPACITPASPQVMGKHCYLSVKALSSSEEERLARIGTAEVRTHSGCLLSMESDRAPENHPFTYLMARLLLFVSVLPGIHSCKKKIEGRKEREKEPRG